MCVCKNPTKESFPPTETLYLSSVKLSQSTIPTDENNRHKMSQYVKPSTVTKEKPVTLLCIRQY